MSYDLHRNMNVVIDNKQSEFISLLTKKAEESGARIINIFDKVCAGDECKLIDDGEYVYSDPGHFNPSWLRKNKNILSDITLE